jgi:hypothetical protein
VQIRAPEGAITEDSAGAITANNAYANTPSAVLLPENQDCHHFSQLVSSHNILENKLCNKIKTTILSFPISI